MTTLFAEEIYQKILRFISSNIIDMFKRKNLKEINQKQIKNINWLSSDAGTQRREKRQVAEAGGGWVWKNFQVDGVSRR